MRKTLFSFIFCLGLASNLFSQISHPLIAKYPISGTYFTVDERGHIFINGPGYQKVSEFDATGALVNQINGLNTGPSEFESGDVTLNYDGNLLISDLLRQRIQVFTKDGTFVKTITQPGGIQPSGIDFDSDNNMYLVETLKHRILVLNQNGDFIKTFGTQGTADGQFTHPAGIAITAERIYVTDGGNNRVQVFDKNGNFLFKFGIGSGPEQLESPKKIAIGESIVHVIDNAYYLRLYDLDGNYLGRQGGWGQTDDTFAYLTDIYFTNSKIFVAEGSGIKVFSSKFSQTISFNPLPVKTFGDSEFILEATAGPNLPVSFSSSDETIASVSGNVVTIHRAGSVTIIANQAGNETFGAAYSVSQTLTIDKASQEITFPSMAEQELDAENLNPGVTASSGLPVSLSTSDESIATVMSNNIRLIKPGAVIITARQEGNENFLSAEPIQRVLIVKKASQNISFSAIPVKTLGDDPFFLEASSSSGLPVQFHTTSDKITLTANKIALVHAGRATVETTQQGDDFYGAAPVVLQSFCINPKNPTIQVDAETSLFTTDHETGNQWFLDGVLIPEATGKTFLPKQTGEYTVQVSVDGCKSEISDDVSWYITGIMEETVKKSFAHPNPVKDILTLDLRDIRGVVKIKVVSNTGQQMAFYETLGGMAYRIDLRDYPPSVYHVKIVSSNNTTFSKIVKY